MNIDTIWSISKKFMKRGRFVSLWYEHKTDTFLLSVTDGDISHKIDIRVRKELEWYDFQNFKWLPCESAQFIIDKLGGLE